jgi:hypothetical protein
LNGNSQIYWLAALCAAGAAAYYYYATSGTGGSGDGSAGDGDSSLGGSSGGASSAAAGALEGITDAAASVGYTLGVYTPKGLRNNNPGNLRYVASIQWNGQVGDDGTGYAVFDSAEHGVRALGHQLNTYAGRGLNTIDDIVDDSGRVLQKGIIPTYAPSNENNTAAYVSAVCGELGLAPTQPFDVNGLLPQLVAAIIHHENGVQPFDLSDLQAWVYEP